MRCFVHHEAEAVAVCRSCLKGTCAACARPVTLGVACSEACLPIADRISQVQLASSRNLPVYRMQPALTLLMILVFLGMGIDNLRYSLTSMVGWFGIVAAVAVSVLFLRARRRKP
ncbi:hypothetical protein KPL74_02405 [Bacillus sp. NP157]|nr:hypothetical protein KPL74_02405 [Bacillus sp. NP157]